LSALPTSKTIKAPPDDVAKPETVNAQLELLARPDLSAQWFELVRFTTRREDPADAGLAFLSFFQAIPAESERQRYEFARLVSTPKIIKGMVKLICKQLDYYPEKEEASKP